MRIRIFVKDVMTGEALEELGTCLTDSPARAVQMYDQDEAWADKGYAADIAWEDITDPAAASLGRRKSERKAASSRENGREGGRMSESVTLINPWSGADAKEMTWLEVKKWAEENVHQADRKEWIRAARQAYRTGDGETLGKMIIGA